VRKQQGEEVFMEQQGLREQHEQHHPLGQTREREQKSPGQPWRNVARWTWRVTTWIWTGILIEFLIQLIPNLLTIVDPVQSLRSTWVAIAVRWLLTSNSQLGWEIVRWAAIGGVFLLILLPLITSATRRLWQEKEGLDKLLAIIQQDTLSPQLKELQQQFKQQLSMMETCATALISIYTLLQHVPTSSDAQKSLQILEESLDKLVSTFQTSTFLPSNVQAFSHTPRRIRKNISEHSKYFKNRNERYNQRKISDDMASILRLFTQILEQNHSSIPTANE
jgi:hypothetical protein